ncbi:Rhomboid protein 2 [Golovinomyces cichoracearum]|uniref:rhomboid protease n=1 Tax=Golovinomyces cichoracearum TaxID=62708 RepID=A0A420H9U6_9PEZI|nr:Rhomboid protein 2 [Golovinomyces cichoracearum]
MTPSLPQFSAARLKGYLYRLPLFTRVVISIIFALSLLSIQTVWNVPKWGALTPKDIDLTSMYRTNTFPLVHTSVFHAFFNILVLTPMLERFEAEYGSLTTLALFFGQRGILRMNTSVLGASIWVFTLLAMEAVKTFRTNPYFTLGTTQIPTWTTPIVLALFVSILIPNTSFLGHLCGLVFGYGCKQKTLFLRDIIT